jgi:hypothetical protein
VLFYHLEIFLLPRIPIHYQIKTGSDNAMMKTKLLVQIKRRLTVMGIAGGCKKRL